MPIYGKASKARTTRKTLNGALDGRIISREKMNGNKIPTRIYSKIHEQPWFYHNTPLKKIQALLNVNLTGIVEQKIKSKPNHKPVVVDWGCSNGNAIRTLAKKFEGAAQCYGIGHRTYPEWKTNRDSKKVKFIHATAEDFFRYFKDESIDLFYAHQALLHLPREVDYIRAVLPKLAKDGKVVTSLDLFNLEKYQSFNREKNPIRIGKRLFKVESNGSAIVITRIA